jgi:cytochrome c oxidase subunit 4
VNARRLLLTWALLLALLAIELGASYLPLSRAARPLILIPALVMVGMVAVVFMEVRQGPMIVRLFAAAGLLWLLILLALGSLDPLTRINYPTSSLSIVTGSERIRLPVA